MANSTATYTDTGQKTLITLDQDKINKFTVKAGASDVYSVEIQLTTGSQRIALPRYKSLSNDCAGRIAGKTYAVGLNITTNASASIIIDVNSE